MSNHAVEFYKTLFGKEERMNIKMEENFWSTYELVTPLENEMLQANFTEEEIKHVIDSSYAEGVPGLMVSPFCFTRNSGRSLNMISWPW
jgi:hypothetical protein